MPPLMNSTSTARGRDCMLGATNENERTMQGSPQPQERVAVSQERARRLLRLTISFIVLVIVTFAAVEGWRVWRDYRNALSAAEDAVTNLARATAQHAEDAIRQVDILTSVLAGRIEENGMAGLDVGRMHDLMVEQTRIMPQLHGLFVYGADGQWIVTDKTVLPDSPNNADRDYFIYHRDHPGRDVLISRVVTSRSTQELVIPVSRRLNNPDGSFAGVILGTVRVAYFVDYYGDFKIDDKGALVLALRDGSILVRRPFMAQVIGKSLAQSEIFKRFLPQSSIGVADVHAVVDGTRRLYGYRALSRYPLVVETGLSRQSILAPWIQDVVKTGLILLLLIGGLSGFGLIVVRQLRERATMEQELLLAHLQVQDMALTDSLTGLGNRRRLDLALPEAIARAHRQHQSVALIMLDVDYFKAFNDHYGHSLGDECLRSIGQAIQQTLQRSTDLAVRYGGEEFTLLLPDTDAAGANWVAERLLQSIRDLDIEHSGHPAGRVTASAGITVHQPRREKVSAQAMIEKADGFLYEAKRQGRDRWCAAVRDTRERLPGTV